MVCEVFCDTIPKIIIKAIHPMAKWISQYLLRLAASPIGEKL